MFSSTIAALNPALSLMPITRIDGDGRRDERWPGRLNQACTIWPSASVTFLR